MKKFYLLILSLLLIQNVCTAKDTLKFDFPNDGWHKVVSPDGVESKKCFVPYNQSSENYTEMLIFSEKNIKTQGITPIVVMQKQLGKDKNNYKDIFPEYISQDIDNPITAWCSQSKNTCSIQRAFQGKEGIILATYINKAPHYSQNIFGQWSNILNNISVYTSVPEKTPSNLIELD